MARCGACAAPGVSELPGSCPVEARFHRFIWLVLRRVPRSTYTAGASRLDGSPEGVPYGLQLGRGFKPGRDAGTVGSAQRTNLRRQVGPFLCRIGGSRGPHSRSTTGISWLAKDRFDGYMIVTKLPIHLSGRREQVQPPRPCFPYFYVAVLRADFEARLRMHCRSIKHAAIFQCKSRRGRDKRCCYRQVCLRERPTEMRARFSHPIHTLTAPNQQNGRSEEHTSELQSRFGISYAVF